MGMTSAAEANLDARVRPQISEMRARTSYPNPRPADQPGQRSDARGTATLTAVPCTPALATGADASDTGPMTAARTGAANSGTARPWATHPGVGGARAASKPSPIRLTKRGRIVVGTIVAIGVAAAAGAIWLAAAGRAQASSQLTPAPRLGNSVLRVVVRPGQTLWGIATQADPAADPRSVIPQIVELNSLTSTAIAPGQVLWVPRG